MNDLSVHQQIFALNVSRLIAYIFSQGYACTFGEAYRTPEQALLNQQKGIGVANSLHCKRLAVDLNLFTEPAGAYLTRTQDYELIGAFWENLHDLNVWGGRFKRGDGNHFEMKDA